jgi:hypothetical protein
MDYKTLLINIDTNQILGMFEDCYKVDGLPCSVIPPVYELTISDLEAPEYNPITQVISKDMVADILNGLYKSVWTIRNKTAHELAMESWHHPAFAKRIIAPVQLVMQYPAVETWFRINDLPIVREGIILYCYCNIILPAHQQLVNSAAGVITIEDRPTE